MKFSVVFFAICGALAAPAGSPFGFKVELNHPDALYKVGEETVFTITATNGLGEVVKDGTARWELGNGGAIRLGKGEVDFAKGNPFVVRGTMDQPDWMRVVIPVEGASKPFIWGVLYEPENIRAVNDEPSDFDAFWQRSIEEEAKTPLDPRIVSVPERSKGEFDFYRINFAAKGGTRMWGFMSVPKDKAKAPFRVRFGISCAGTGMYTADMSNPEPDRICVFLTVHEFEPPATQAELTELHRQLEKRNLEKYGDKDYSFAGILGDSPADYYFHRVILAANRVADWVRARPDVDHRYFDYVGGSQGGFLGWAVVALNGHFTSACLTVPAGCDLAGSKAKRQEGWPGIYRPWKYRQAAQQERAFRNAAYYNGATFARRITCAVRVTTGLADRTCSPSSVYAAFNELKTADKEIRFMIGRGHGGETANVDNVFRIWQKTRK